MIKITRILFILYSVNLFSAQNAEEFKKLMDSYKKQKVDQEANEMIKGIESEGSEAQGPVRLLVEPGDLTKYYNEKINFIKKDLDKLNRLLIFSDSIPPISHFGYNYFSVRDSIPFVDNMNVTSNYVLGYGDEVIISIWGQAEQHERKILDRDGTIFIENVGLLYLGGKTQKQAKVYAQSRFSKVYATLNEKPQLTFLELSLGKIKNINVSIAGHVKYPGNYVVNPSISISNILVIAGGINDTGSLRKIILQRNQVFIDTLDLYPLITGIGLVSKTFISDGDIVIVPPRGETIAITGEVLNPGYFELGSVENISNLLEYSGVINTRDSVGVIISNPKSNNTYVPRTDFDKTFLFHGDSLIVPKLSKPEKLLSISVSNRPTLNIPWIKNLSFSQIIELTNVNIENIQSVELIRRNIINNKQEILSFDLNANADLKFLPFNHLSIHLFQIFNPTKSVVVKGEVNSPGTYPLINNDESLTSVLARAGGFQGQTSMNNVIVKRDTLSFGSSTGELMLSAGDTIIVKPHIGTVKVEGEVHNPGNFEWKKDESVKNYISFAGGLTAYGDEKHIVYITPYGEAKKIKSNSNNQILPGSIIRISEIPLSKQNIFIDRYQQISILINSLVSLAILANTTN